MNMEISFQGAFPDGEWDFTRMFSSEDPHPINVTNSDQFPGLFNSFPGEDDVGLQFSPIPELTNIVNESLFYSLNPELLNSQENSSSSNCSSSVFAPNSDHSYIFSDSMSMDFCIVDHKNSNLLYPPEISMTEAVSVSEKISNNSDTSTLPPKDSQLKRKFEVPESEINPPDNARKKTRVPRNATKSKKNEKASKNPTPKSQKEELEERNGGEEGQSTSSCSSGEDNATQEALNSSGKARASRGSATDPQSLYARKRRERINERLRILQNLVPNGTKVDISTMLEEAVQYVKFLQLQIKLLSSDKMWMYAPIAYNGMDIGLNQKLSMLL